MTPLLLEDDHASLDALLDEVRHALGAGDGLGASEAGSDADAREVFTLLDALWARLAMHIRAEHLWLFPALLASARDEITTPSRDEVERAVSRLRVDHDFFMRELAVSVNALRDLTSAPEGRDARAELEGVRVVVNAVATRLAEHNALEEREVYEWVQVLLDAEAQARLVAGVRREIERLPPRFVGAARSMTHGNERD